MVLVLGIWTQILTLRQQALRCGCWGSEPLMQSVGNPSSKFNIFPLTEAVFHLVKQTYKTMKETDLTQ